MLSYRVFFAVGCSDEAFTNSGFRNWKHGSGKTGKLAKHAKSRMHLLSLERMQNFKTVTPVDIQLNEAAREMRERKERERSENRHIVGVIFDIVRHLAKQNVAFRGHDETSSSKNKGNFLEEIYFLSKYHQPLKDWIDKHPQNVSYLSHVGQNEMLAICSSLTANAICDEVHTAKYFSIECDEVTSHKKAFMSIILRYVSNFQIHERCFKLVPVTSLTGRSLADVILSVLSDNQLSIMALVGKGFDGAANMSGKDEGFQQHLFDAGAALSVYFHCFAHRLNLVLEHSVENVSTVKTVFETIGNIYRSMDGSSKRRALYNEHVKQQQITSGKTALHALSDTRWTARSDNLDTIMNVYLLYCQCFNRCHMVVMAQLLACCSELNNSILSLLVLSFKNAFLLAGMLRNVYRMKKWISLQQLLLSRLKKCIPSNALRR